MRHVLWKNISFSFLTIFLQIGTMSIMYFGVARYLSIEEFGTYTFITVFVSSIMAFGYLGIQPIMVKEIAADQENAGTYIGKGLIVRVSGLLFSAFVVILATRYMDLGGVLLLAILLVLLSEFFNGISTLLRGFFHGIGRMEVESAIVFLFALCIIGFYLLIFSLGLGFLALFGALLLAHLLQLVLNILVLRRHVHLRFPWSDALDLLQYREVLLVGTAIFLRINMPKAGVLALKLLSSDTEIALYRAAQSLFLFVEQIPAAITIAAFPILSIAYQSGGNNPPRLFHRILFVYVLAAGSISIIFSLFCQEIIFLLYGDKYSAATPLLALMSPLTFPLFVNALFAALLIILKRHTEFLIAASIGILVSCIGFTLFIPYMGYLGAGLSNLLGYFSFSLVAMWFLSRSSELLAMPSLWSEVSAPLAAGLMTLLSGLLADRFLEEGALTIKLLLIVTFLGGLLWCYKGHLKEMILFKLPPKVMQPNGSYQFISIEKNPGRHEGE